MYLLGIIQYHAGIAYYHKVLIEFNIFVGFCWVLSDIAGFVRYCEGLKKHLDNPLPNGDFPVLHCHGIILLVLGIFPESII
jgi:hypothetical protein